jgi:hypothetical protein
MIQRHRGIGVTPTKNARRQAEEREAQVFGDGPRLLPIQVGELSSELLDILRRFDAVNGVLQSNAEGDRRRLGAGAGTGAVGS